MASACVHVCREWTVNGQSKHAHLVLWRHLSTEDKINVYPSHHSIWSGA